MRHSLTVLSRLSLSKRHHPAPSSSAIWLYLRFSLSYRDVEELLAERGLPVSYETIRRWVLTFGPVIARRLRARRPVLHGRWHLDEIFIRIAGKPMYLWRAVDAEDEILEVLTRTNRNKRAAVKLIRKLLKKHGTAPAEGGDGQVPRLWRGAPRVDPVESAAHSEQEGQ